MDIVLSGIRSTGKLHLGNYFGALRNFIRMQDENRCYFFIADLHSLTTHPDPKMLHENVKNVLVDYLAAGLDPEKSVIYVQSDVKEVIELYLYLNMHAYLGELAKTVSFKEKARKQPKNVNAGLFTYPTLMAADILVHRADKVPVGKDQEQHLEMTRRFARRFNNLYGVEYFKEPVAYNFGEELVKIDVYKRQPKAYRQTVEQLAERYRGEEIDQVLAIESRGFIFGAALALELGAGFVPVRKPGKLPSDTIAVEYSLEYGTNRLEIHTDAIRPGERVRCV